MVIEKRVPLIGTSASSPFLSEAGINAHQNISAKLDQALNWYVLFDLLEFII